MKRLRMTMLAMSVACLMASATAVSAEVSCTGVVQAVSGTSLTVDGPARNDLINGTMIGATHVESKQTHKAMTVAEIRRAMR